MASANNQPTPKYSGGEEDESLPFLENKQDAPKSSSAGKVSIFVKDATQCCKDLSLSKHTIIHGTIFIIYSLLFLYFSTESLIHKPEGELSWSSPAEGILEYEAIPVDGHADESIYSGKPSPETEAAWSALMTGINVKIYPEEMEKLKTTSLEMRDGSGSLAVLAVYHEIHCVKRLRKWFYRDHYYPNMTDLEYNERFTHAEHCLEFIRQSAICHGDVTVTSFKWLHDSRGRIIEPTTKEGALHRCVKWDRIADWAKSRRVDLFNHSLLAPENLNQS